jgi:hypothetical protein
MMANEPTLSAEITGELQVGLEKVEENECKLVIKNEGAEIQQPDGDTPFIFYLTGSLGSSEDALFRDEDEARSCDKAAPKGWQADWDFGGTDSFELRIFTDNFPILKKGGAVTITFSNVRSSTEPGQAELRFGTDLNPNSIRKLQVKKVAPSNVAILDFSCDPPEETELPPGLNVKLRWHTVGLKNRKLTQNGSPLEVDFSRDEGSFTAESVSEPTTFKLSGDSVSRTLSVWVCRPGWHSQEHKLFPGNAVLPQPRVEDPAYKVEVAALKSYQKAGLPLQPTEIINANDRIYGVFRYKLREKETVLLFETGETFGQWTPVDCKVPEGFSESPAVYFENQIWWVGGSQIDPDLTSNVVHRLDPKNKTSAAPETAGWCARMGHAVLIFDREIWVMGGRDSAGNALNDIWRRDTKSSAWIEVKPEGERWSRRCLFHPVVFDQQIWIYGGVKEPFSREVYSDLWVYPSRSNPKRWEELKITGFINDDGKREPIASCLQVLRNTLYLFGTFRKTTKGSAGFDRLAFSLGDRDMGKWNVLPTGKLKTWGSTNTFSWQVANFRDKYLIAKALALGESITDMKLYIDGKVRSSSNS